jgi:hypothetical protein
MKRTSLFLLLLCCAAIIVFLVSCGTGASSTQSEQNAMPIETATVVPVVPGSLATVDWANFTYTSSCYGNTQPFHVTNGQAVNNGVHLEVFSPKYGDLTGSGQLEAVILYQCSAADAMGRHVFVYTGSAKQPVLIGNLPPAGAANAIADITAMAIDHKTLHLEGRGYSSSAPHCCPDLFIKTDYTWNGSAFVVVKSSVGKL